MCEAVESYAEQKAENARMNSLLKAVKNLMANMNLLGVSDSDRKILQKRL